MLNKSNRGFTLIEVLLAIFIFTIVMVTIFGSYRSVANLTQALDGRIDKFQMASNCLNRMLLDIRAVYIEGKPKYTPPDFNSAPNPFRVQGKIGDNDFPLLRFASYAHISFGKDMREGIAEIIYYVEHDEQDDQYVLKRKDSLAPYPKEFNPESGDPVLCENIKTLKFIYYDDEGEESDNWDSESKQIKYATPRAVRVKLEIGDESDSLFFETMIEFSVFREKTS